MTSHLSTNSPESDQKPSRLCVSGRFGSRLQTAAGGASDQMVTNGRTDERLALVGADAATYTRLMEGVR